MIKLPKYLLVILFSFVCFLGKSQIKSIGVPTIYNYSRHDYNASTQNWTIIQDKRGVLYVGNNDGVLEFDGINWKKITITNSSVIRSLATDKEGNIYVGAFNEFGRLEVTDDGGLEYKSLSTELDEELKNFGDIWKIHETENGIIFQSFSELFLFSNGKLEVLAQKREFQFSFYINNELFITERSRGLLKLIDEKLIPVAGGDVFENDVWTMLPFNNSKILIGSRDKGLFILEENVIKKWDVGIDNFFIENKIYTGQVVKGSFAIGTILNGLIIIDTNGNPIQHINRRKGLQNNTVLSIYADNNDNLWLGLDNGIDYVVTNSPFTNLIHKSELGAGYTSCIYQGYLYLGTNQGVFYKKWKDVKDPLNENDDFKIIEGTQGQVWSLYIRNNQLLCGHNNGTYLIHHNKARQISGQMGGWLFVDIIDQAKSLLQGTYNGISRFQLNNNSWSENKIEGFNESCRIIEIYLEKNNYTLWIGHGYKGIFRVKLNKQLDKILKIDFFNSKSGLQTDFDNSVLRFNDEVIFTNRYGIYSFDENSNQFVINSDLTNIFGTTDVLRKVVKDNEENLWFIQGEELGVVKRLNDGTFKVNRNQFKSFAGSFVRSFEHILPYEKGNLIIATEDGFTHLSADFDKDINIPFSVLIRSVRITGDSTLFDGAFQNEYGFLSKHQTSVKELPYKFNDIKFELSATHFENLKEIEFSYYLEGFDEEWSDWSERYTKEYTNLKAGVYTFHVKARNLFGIVTQESNYKFTIVPPFYKSLSAYIIYLLLLAIIVWGVVKLIKKRLRREKLLMELKQKKELQQQDINHRNTVLSAQQEIVKLRNDKLRAENEKNKAEVELKTKELASYAMQITQKNETLYNMKEQLKSISERVNPDAQKHLRKLIHSIEKDTNKKKDWEKFEKYFDQVYEDFTKIIRDKYPQLTPNDIKLCAYLRMNLSTKEIAPLLNISIRGVEVSRYRLRRKLNLDKDVNLIDFMMNISN